MKILKSRYQKLCNCFFFFVVLVLGETLKPKKIRADDEVWNVYIHVKTM